MIQLIINLHKEIKSYLDNFEKSDLNYTGSIGFGGDNTLKVDKKIEDIFIKYLSPYFNIFSEECGFIDNNKDYTAIIDPLDGSNNFLNDIPFCASSLYIKDNISAIYDIYRDTLFIKTDKIYIFKDNKLVEKTFNYNNSNIGCFEKAYSSKLASKLQKYNIKYRTLGSIALAILYLEKFSFVLFDSKIREFDVVAGLEFHKSAFLYKDDNYLLISYNKKIFNLIKNLILN